MTTLCMVKGMKVTAEIQTFAKYVHSEKAEFRFQWKPLGNGSG